MIKATKQRGLLIYIFNLDLNVLQGCICKFEKVREIPHPAQKTAGFWNFCAGFSVLPEKTIHNFVMFILKVV